MIEKIVSGGQSGVDRAALDAAIEHNIRHGGWCPKGRMAEKNETIPMKYDLRETSSSDYPERTRMNVEDSDGTLIIVDNLPIEEGSGTELTKNIARSIGKPILVVNISVKNDFKAILQWISSYNIQILNVAGPRESTNKGIYNKTLIFLGALFKFSKK